MNLLLKLASYAGLALTIIPSVLVLAGSLPPNDHKIMATAGMGLWFFTAPFWINKQGK